METVRPCGCKGIRTCLICEKEFNISKTDNSSELKKKDSYTYCIFCNKAWSGWDIDWNSEHAKHDGKSHEFPGVYILPEFLSKTEAKTLLQDLDELPWDSSQSGRRKQNYGPKCNFKKRRLRIGSFDGFPETTKFVQDGFRKFPVLESFQTIEQCSLEYTADRGASIDPHIDDCWIWGERIVTVNVLGDSVLTMTPYKGSNVKYNLECVANLASLEDTDAVVRLPMPQGSLMVLYGQARYNWEHAVLREDVRNRRVCLAYREFTAPYLPGSKLYSESKEIYEKAKCFW